jgi:copper oxidase (laccase) domain-containing protein
MADYTAAGILGELSSRMEPEARRWLEPREAGGIPLLSARLPGAFRLGFTTRRGVAGVDGFSVARDRKDARRLLAEALSALDGPDGAQTSELVSPVQVHGVRVVGAAEYRLSPGRPCDGLTVHPLIDDGLAALLLFADCVPVVLVGEVDAALVHGGWRGILAGVVQQGARTMTAPPGMAVIGPSIGPCCYRVGEEVARSFAERYGHGCVLPGPRLDLWAAATAALAEVGVAPERVRNPRLCTACNSDLFFSFRREGDAAGRHGAVLWGGSEPGVGPRPPVLWESKDLAR